MIANLGTIELMRLSRNGKSMLMCPIRSIYLEAIDRAQRRICLTQRDHACPRSAPGTAAHDASASGFATGWFRRAAFWMKQSAGHIVPLMWSLVILTWLTAA